MREIGKVIEILNKQYLLIESPEDLYPEMTVIVCGVAQLKNRTTIEIESVRYPKGKLEIVSKQKENIFLASTAKFEIEQKTVYRNPLAPAARVLSDYFGEQERIYERVPIESPAIIDESQSLNINMPMKVQVGDIICVEES